MVECSGLGREVGLGVCEHGFGPADVIRGCGPLGCFAGVFMPEYRLGPCLGILKDEGEGEERAFHLRVLGEVRRALLLEELLSGLMERAGGGHCSLAALGEYGFYALEHVLICIIKELEVLGRRGMHLGSLLCCASRGACMDLVAWVVWCCSASMAFWEACRCCCGAGVSCARARSDRRVWASW